MGPDPDRRRLPDGFEAFAVALAHHLDGDATGWGPDDLLDDRLAWDSLTVVEVRDWLEDHQVRLPEDLIGELRTLGDLHHYATAPGTSTAAPTPGPRHQPPSAVALEPVRRGDEDALFELFTAPGNLTHFRLRGITPSPETFHTQLWELVLTQFTVRPAPGGPILGLVTAYQPDLRNHHVHLAAAATPGARGTGAVVDGTIAFVDHLFETFPLRKVYAETLSANLEQFASGVGRYFEIEGRLRDHEYVDGGYQDLLILATTRAHWEARRRPGT